MSEQPVVESAKVMAKGQITLPKEIRESLGVGTGDRVVLISTGNHQAIIMNAGSYAMKVFQDGMKGEAEKAGLNSDEDVVNMIMEMRREAHD
jgi:AbrB family looped-hinge helix DNA binding protein